MPNIMVNASFHLSISYGECHKHMLPLSWNGLCPCSKTTSEDKDPIETNRHKWHITRQVPPNLAITCSFQRIQQQRYKRQGALIPREKQKLKFVPRQRTGGSCLLANERIRRRGRSRCVWSCRRVRRVRAPCAPTRRPGSSLPAPTAASGTKCAGRRSERPQHLPT